LRVHHVIAGEGRTPKTTSRDGVISGYVLKLARESINCTQVELAQQLAVDPNTIHSWETGRRSLAATSVRDLAQIGLRLSNLGVNPALIDGLNPALEADHILNRTLSTGHGDLVGGSHPLASWLLPHSVSEMLAWPLIREVPSAISRVLPKSARRGPVASGPPLAIPERRRFFENVEAAAELTLSQPFGGEDGRSQLAHQLYLRIGWNREPEAREWLQASYARHRARYPRFDRWSPRWLELRSLVIALANHRDPEPLTRFVRTAHESDECKMANLNYWAYWAGELRERQWSQEFMVSMETFRSWTGVTLLRRLIRKLDATNSYLELNIHSIATLLDRPIAHHLLDGDRELAWSLSLKVDGLLEQPAVVSDHGRRQLDAIRHSISSLPARPKAQAPE
jgi:transcriptional regulator with XRE-family HTH domain